MHRTNSVDKCALVSRDRVIEALRRELRGVTQIARKMTVEEVAIASGVPLRTVRSYMANDDGEVREATLSNALAIAVVLGPRAINALLAIIGYTGARPMDEPDEVNPALITAQALAGLSTIANAAADGRIDHTEVDDCRVAADQIIAIVLPLSSAGQAA